MFLGWLMWPYFVAILTHGMFGRSFDLPSMREIARKTRLIMNPVSPEERHIMSTPDTTVKTREAAETVVIVTGVGLAAAAAVIVLRKFGGYISDRTVDAVVNTMTHAKSKKLPSKKDESTVNS